MNNEQLIEVLNGIASASDGVLHPEDVVEAARPADHPLHYKFEWDDAAAAQAHRIEQARVLIRSVKIRIATETRRIETVYYTRDPRALPDESGYISLPRLRTEREMAEESVAMEFERIEALLKRVRDLALGVGLDKAAKLADDLLRQLGQLKPIEQKDSVAVLD